MNFRLKTYYFACVLDFFVMGSPWSINYEEMANKTVFKDKLSKVILDLLSTYDETFSDWSEKSELRTLEKNGFLKPQKVSPIFLEGIVLAKQFFDETNGLFDITTGALYWEKLKSPVGMSCILINKEKQIVSFTIDPKRLSFGGFLKGFLVGKISKILFQAGIKSFSVNSGGSTLASFKNGTISFTSSSSLQQKGRIHIFSPLKEKAKFTQKTVQYYSKDNVITLWPYFAALTDVMATVLVLKDRALPRDFRAL